MKEKTHDPLRFDRKGSLGLGHGRDGDQEPTDGPLGRSGRWVLDSIERLEELLVGDCSLSSKKALQPNKEEEEVSVDKEREQKRRGLTQVRLSLGVSTASRW